MRTPNLSSAWVTIVIIDSESMSRSSVKDFERDGVGRQTRLLGDDLREAGEDFLLGVGHGFSLSWGRRRPVPVAVPGGCAGRYFVRRVRATDGSADGVGPPREEGGRPSRVILPYGRTTTCAA